MRKVEFFDFGEDGEWRVVDDDAVFWIFCVFVIAARIKWTNYLRAFVKAVMLEHPLFYRFVNVRRRIAIVRCQFRLELINKRLVLLRCFCKRQLLHFPLLFFRRVPTNATKRIAHKSRRRRGKRSTSIVASSNKKDACITACVFLAAFTFYIIARKLLS